MVLENEKIVFTFEKTNNNSLESKFANETKFMTINLNFLER